MEIFIYIPSKYSPCTSTQRSILILYFLKHIRYSDVGLVRSSERTSLAMSCIL